MAESKSGKMSITSQSSKISDFLAAMVGTYNNIQQAGMNLSYLQEPTHKKTSASCHHGYSQAGYRPSEHLSTIHHPHHSGHHLHPEDWAAHHSYSALSQCLPVEPSHETNLHATFYPATEPQDYGRCSTPDIIQSVLQMDAHDVSPISKMTTPNGQCLSINVAPTSPVTSPHTSIWRSPGGREYMDSGYLSEDSLSSFSTSVYHTKPVACEKEQTTRIPAFTSFLPSLSQTALHQTDVHKPQKTLKATRKINSKYTINCSRSSSSSNQATTSSPVSSFKYEPVSPVQVSSISSEVSPTTFRHQSTSSDVSSVNIQSSQISTSEEKPTVAAGEMKTHSQSVKRKLSDTDLQTETERSSTEVKRGRHNEPLNNRAIAVMTAWYNAHMDNPYPNKEDKQKMAEEGGIRVSQVKSWFANKRNRSNNTRPKVQKQQLQDRLLTLCHTLAKDQQQVMDNSFIIQQLSTLITSAQR